MASLQTSSTPWYSNLFRYLVPLLVGGVLLRRFYSNSGSEELWGGLGEVRWLFVGLAVVAHWVNHALRAYRWGMLLRTQGHAVPFHHLFLAEMSGFFFNMIVPRGGEWLRCHSLQNLSGVEVSRSFGAVVVERSADILFFLLLLAGTLLLGAVELQELLTAFVLRFYAASSWQSLLFVLLAFALVVVATRLVYQRYRNQSWAVRVRASMQAVLRSILTATRANNTLAFWFTTFLIWAFYFGVEYSSLRILEATSHLSIYAAFCLFLIMNVSMMLPVPGGIGAYHVAMQKGLEAFGVSPLWMTLYITLTHSIQMFNGLVVGGICFFAATYLLSAYTERPAAPGEAEERE